MELPKYGAVADKTKVSMDMQFDSFWLYINRVKSLSEEFKNDIKKYYSGHKIERVEKFVSWLEKNEKWLLQQIKKDYAEGRIKINTKNLSEKEIAMIIGFYCGSRYIASQYGKIEEMYFPPLSVLAMAEDWLFTGGASGTEYFPFLLEINRNQIMPKKIGKIDAFIFGVNIGIHEATHSMPIINQSPKNDSDFLRLYRDLSRLGKNVQTSEFATMYTQTNYSLPIKKEHIEFYYLGVRNFFHNIEKLWEGFLEGRGDDLLPFNIAKREYSAFVLGPWIITWMKKNKIKLDIFSYNAKSMLDILKETVIKDIPLTAEENATAFCDINGIKNEKVKQKLVEFFSKLKEKGVQVYVSKVPDIIYFTNPREDFDKFIETANEVFGEPAKSDIPDDYCNVFDAMPKDYRKRSPFFQKVDKA
ncbi:MAG: hypothetical protein N3G80_01540 [Candidatus Micrarchaeota archaeon]|nr:hypothetical protein [Candidatus Micrarchaeota archaeon]